LCSDCISIHIWYLWAENVSRVYDSQVLQIYPWPSVPKIVIMNVVLCVTYRHGHWAHKNTTIYDNSRVLVPIIFYVHVIGEEALTRKIDRRIFNKYSKQMLWASINTHFETWYIYIYIYIYIYVNFFPTKIIYFKLNPDILRLLPNGCVKFLPLLSIDF